MKKDRRIIACIIYTVIGITLLVLGILEIVDSFWSGMGGALIAVGLVRMIHILRYHHDEAYQENMEIEMKDERNRFIRSRAWVWAGYLFIMVAAVASIVCRALGLDQQSMAAGLAVCILVLLYWISYLVLRKKY